MKIAYLDCLSGVSGDMMLGALVDAGADLAAIQSGIDSLGLPSCRLEAQEVKKKGFRAIKVNVVHEPEHKHRHLHHITGMIDASRLSPSQKDLAKRIFTRLGEAEAKVHGTTIQKVHFHEVGAVDSIADVVGSAIGLDLLGVERLVCSPVPTGSGFVEIAHGRVSIPAPATAELLQGVPIAPSAVQAELTTPTGAAIVATAAESFGPLPAMRIERIGYGAGTRDLETQANLLRLIVGQTDEAIESDQVWILETNLDDVSGEVIGHTTARLDGCRGTGRVHHGHPDEEEPAGGHAERDLPGGRRVCGWRRSSSAKRRRWASAAGRPAGTSCSARRARSRRPGVRSPASWRSPRAAQRGFRRSTRTAAAWPANATCRWPTCTRRRGTRINGSTPASRRKPWSAAELVAAFLCLSGHGHE